MRFIYSKASESSFPYYGKKYKHPIEFDSLEAMTTWCKETGHDVIITMDTEPPELQIYDSPVE